MCCSRTDLWVRRCGVPLQLGCRARAGRLQMRAVAAATAAATAARQRLRALAGGRPGRRCCFRRLPVGDREQLQIGQHDMCRTPFATLGHCRPGKRSCFLLLIIRHRQQLQYAQQKGRNILRCQKSA